MKTTVNFLSLLLSILIITSCKKDDVTKSADIYLAGSVYKSDGAPTAAYWKNGQLVELTTNVLSSGLSSIVVNKNIVYALGHEDFKKLVLWKNGERMVIVENVISCFPKGLAVQGNDVYILADVYKDQSHEYPIPTIYKNGIPIELTDGNSSATSQAIAINNNTVYVAGCIYKNNIPTAVVWKDKTLIKLSDGTQSAFAEAITTKGNDVYIAGSGGGSKAPVGLVWKNMNKADSLISPTGYKLPIKRITGIAVDDKNNVYVAGFAAYQSASPTNYYIAWKNGNAGKTPVMSGSIFDVIGAATFYNNSFYVAAVANGRVGYWKNNEPVAVAERMGIVVDIFINEN